MGKETLRCSGRLAVVRSGWMETGEYGVVVVVVGWGGGGETEKGGGRYYCRWYYTTERKLTSGDTVLFFIFSLSATPPPPPPPHPSRHPRPPHSNCAPAQSDSVCCGSTKLPLNFYVSCSKNGAEKVFQTGKGKIPTVQYQHRTSIMR